MDTETSVRDMTDDELLETYYYVSDKCASRSNINDATLFSSLANVYATELTRRETKKSNRAIQIWTMATGIMTAVILTATIVNVFWLH